MCGIWTYISKNKKDYYNYFNAISHRGPDASIYMTLKDVNIGFHRLSIINKNFTGMQPFIDNNMIFLYIYLINIVHNSPLLLLYHRYK